MQLVVKADSWDALMRQSVEILKPFSACRVFKLTMDLFHAEECFVDALDDYRFMEIVEHMFSGQTVMLWNTHPKSGLEKKFEIRFRFRAKGITLYHPKYKETLLTEG
ncbi:hypothetical protein [Persicobacter diffluens]|uniref:Uncharacterized protein n=1 Tax=Persicobacter diffluens TaxID=981 RepID=A0AAN5AKJ1_9BACT|nr:hypothetical protein PEDI_10280 [Persicobacter diffluens]